MAPAARARDGQASFTTYMAETNWRALRRQADDHDLTRSSILEALLERHLAATGTEQSSIIARAQEITQRRRSRSD